MLYLILENNVAREYSIKELKTDNPMVSFPDPIPESVLADWNVYPYTEAATPSHDTKTQTLSHGDFSQDSNNDWVRGWNVSNLSQSEAEDRCRGERNRLLKETDYLHYRQYTVRLYDNIQTSIARHHRSDG